LSFYIIFLALLVTATPASAWHIEGIQGRYFTYPLLFISYSLGYKNTSSDSKTRFTCLLLVFVFLITSIASSMDALIQRYYVQLPEWMEKSKTLSISKMTMWSNYSKQVKTKSLLYNNSLAYNNIGKLLFETGNYDEAENMILHAIELRPFYSNAYTNLTLLYLKTSRYDKALVTGLKAVKLENTPENQLNLADAYRYLHRYNDSIKYYNGALSLRNNYFEALVSLANTYLLIKDTANAAIYLNKSYQITTGYSMFYLVCSKYYIYNNNKLEALKFAQTSVELDSNSDECHLNLGQLYYDSRNYKDAITELSRAIKLNKYNIDALDTLGNLYLSISQFSLAAELYSRALMINNIDMVAIQGLKNCNLSK
jgi:tetratricopeptide (TPR) repeat protein